MSLTAPFSPALLLGDTLDAAQALTGATLCVRQYQRTPHPLLALLIAPASALHYAPYCRLCQSLDGKVACTREHDTVLPAQALARQAAFPRACYAGVLEGVLPVLGEDGLAAVLLLTGCRTGDFAQVPGRAALCQAAARQDVPMQALEAAYQALPLVPLESMARVCRLAGNTLSALLYAFSIAQVPAADPADRYVHEACSRIIAAVNQGLSLADMAAQMHVSREHLSRLFHRTLGVSMQEYLLQARTARACLLLTNTNLTLNEIAQAVGLPDSAYFSRFFKKRMGMMPSAYRRSFSAGGQGARIK